MKKKELKEDGKITPAHYMKGGLHLLEIMEMKFPKEQVEGYLRCNVLKYLMRYDQKNGIEDLKKAEWYLDELIALKERQEKK